MNDNGPKGSGRWSLPNWRRISDFFITVAQLERSYESLKTENQSLKSRMADLEAEVADHSGQLRILTAFLQTAVKDFTEANMEKAVARQLERLTDKRSLPPSESR